jgi:acyl dehydratase
MIGKEYAPFSFEIERGKIRAFAMAIGETNPVYFEESAARRAGYRAIPVPPTFPFAVIMESNQGFLVLDDLGVDKRQSMHAEQTFVYHGDICAGDVINGRQRVVETYEKKGGALQFVVTEIRLENQNREHVCDLRNVVVIRRG